MLNEIDIVRNVSQRLDATGFACMFIAKETDTSPKMEAVFRERLMALLPQERWRRGALMFGAARSMVMASMPEGLPEDERRRWLWQWLIPKCRFPNGR